MLNWINFLHLYQPPEQDGHIFHQVTRESYAELARLFDRFGRLETTMNLSGSLLEQLAGYGYDGVLDDFRQAFDAGKLELVASAMYHPLLPLLPLGEIERQILLDEEIKSRIFGEGYTRQGFYLPEMAYSRPVAELLEKMGFKWIILDEVSAAGKLGSCDTGKPYRIKGLEMKVIFRDRKISSTFVPETIDSMPRSSGEERNIVTATDGELYGHRHRDFYGKIQAVLTDERIRTYRVNDFLSRSGEELEEIEPVDSSWESQDEELAAGIPFALWKDPSDEIQLRLWELADIAIKVVEERRQDRNHAIARGLLDRGLSSCHFWAAAGRISFSWKELVWNPDVVERGNSFLIRSVRSLVSLETSKRLEAEAKSRAVSELLWRRHWEEFHKG